MKINLPRACTWTVDSTDPDCGICTSGDGLVFHMERAEAGVGWRPKLVAGKAIWNGYGRSDHAATIFRRVSESLQEAWASEVDAKRIPLVVDPRSVRMAIKQILATSQC